MFSFFVKEEVVVPEVEQQLLYVTDHILQYEARHLPASYDKLRRYGTLYYEICEMLRHHDAAKQQQVLAHFHQRAYERLLVRKKRIEHIWDVYRLLKGQQTTNLTHQLRFYTADIEQLYEQLQAYEQFHYDDVMAQQFFEAFYEHFMPIAVALNDIYR